MPDRSPSLASSPSIILRRSPPPPPAAAGSEREDKVKILDFRPSPRSHPSLPLPPIFPIHNEEAAAFLEHRPTSSRPTFSNGAFAAGKLYTSLFPCARFPIPVCCGQSLLRLVPLLCWLIALGWGLFCFGGWMENFW